MGPSVNGACDTTAATFGSPAAVATTWPPLKDVPHRAMRFGSIPSSERAWPIAAVQSSSWLAMDSSCRGSPSLAPKWR